MKRLCFLMCLISVSSTQSQVDPRGARPVEPGTRSEKCATEKEWPFCTDVEWGPKCPSGCRIQGLMEKYDHNLLKKVERIRSLLDQHKAKHRSADQVSKQTYDYLKEKLTTDAGSNNNYFDLAQTLRQRITDMKIKIDRQMTILAALKDRVKDQVIEMQRLEVDIDIKLRSCKGSCAGYSEYQVDQESYVNLNKQVQQLDSQAPQTVESVGTLHVMKSRPLRDMVVDSVFKSKDVEGAAGQQTADMFPDVRTVHLVLEEEGSSSSPATISKVPGTSYSSSTSSSSSSSSSSSTSSTSSKSITELRGRGDADTFGLGGGSHSLGQPSTSHVSTKTITCTKRTRTTVIQTSDGPVEKTEEVIEGGPGCQVTGDFTKGGISSLFPSLTHTSSSSSTGSTKTVHLSSTKGSVSGNTKTGFSDPFDSDVGIDLGAFLTDNTEDDVPDFHARSVKTASRIERQADYVGKVCIRFKQQNEDGRQSPSETQMYRKQRCQAKLETPLCLDNDWFSKCPSGCRLQGLISQMENKVEGKLREVCKRAQMYEDATEKSMTAMTHIYNFNRRVIVNRYMSKLKFVEQAEELARNFTALQKRSTSLSQQIKILNSKLQKQIEELYRTEVDIDMKLRACHGSCQSVLPFGIDHPDYHILRSHMENMDETLNRRTKSPLPPTGIPHIKLQPIDVVPEPAEGYKTIPTVHRELLTQFEDIGQNQITLEEQLEGSEDANDHNHVERFN